MPLFSVLFLTLFIPLNYFSPSHFWGRFWNINHTGTRPYLMMGSVPIKTPTPTAAPTSVPNPKPTSTPIPPTSTPQPLPENNIRNFMMGEINNFRRSKGLGAVSTDSYTCNFAQTRAQEITTNFSHDGFNQRVSSKTLPYPPYHLIVENLARVGSYKDVVNLWINSSGHNANLSADVSFACVGDVDDFYAYEGWKP